MQTGDTATGNPSETPVKDVFAALDATYKVYWEHWRKPINNGSLKLAPESSYRLYQNYIGHN